MELQVKGATEGLRFFYVNGVLSKKVDKKRHFCYINICGET